MRAVMTAPVGRDGGGVVDTSPRHVHGGGIGTSPYGGSGKYSISFCTRRAVGGAPRRPVRERDKSIPAETPAGAPTPPPATPPRSTTPTLPRPPPPALV